MLLISRYPLSGLRYGRLIAEDWGIKNDNCSLQTNDVRFIF